MKHKKHMQKQKHKKKRKYETSSSSSSSEEEWVEKPSAASRSNEKSDHSKPATVESKSFMKPPEDDGERFSFLDFALSSSSLQQKAKDIPDKKVTPKEIQLPVGLYYPNRKNDEQPSQSTDNMKKEKEEKEYYKRYAEDRKDSYRKNNDSRPDRRYDGENSDRSNTKYNDKYNKNSERQRSDYERDSKDYRQRHDKERQNSDKYYKKGKDDRESERSDRYARDERRSKDDRESERSDRYARDERRSKEERESERSDRYERRSKEERESEKLDYRNKNNRSYGKHDGQQSAKKHERNERGHSSDEESDNSIGEHEYHSRSTSENKLDKSEHNKKAIVTHYDVNKIASKLMKAELMGDMELVKELKIELEQARSEKVVTKPQERKQFNDHKRRTESGEPRERVIQITEQNFKAKRRMELLEKKKLAFLGNYEDRFVSAEKIYENIGDELEEVKEPKKKKLNTGAGSSSQQQSQIHEHKRITKILDSCVYCMTSSNINKTKPIVIEQFPNECYLCIPNHEPLVQHHCMIISEDHFPCLTKADQSTYSKIQTICDNLVEQFSKLNKICIFFEMASNLKWNHLKLHCLPISKKKGDMAPLYFQKAITDLETDMSQNKVLIKVERNITKVVPKELDYFYVSFGWKKGFAHIIESKLSNTFAEEIIGGMLDLKPSLWRNPQPLNTDTKMKYKSDFFRVYKKQQI